MNRTIIIGIVGFILLSSALGLNFWLNNDTNELKKPDITIVKPNDNKTTQKASPVIEDSIKMIEDSIKSEIKVIHIPEFDVVRIAENGDTVIAGRAAANSKLYILDGTDEIGVVTSDDNGEWVFLPTKPLSSGNRELSLKSILPDGTVYLSENIVVLIVPEKGKNIAGETSENTSLPLALLVPRNGKDATSKILQKPSINGHAEAKNGQLLLDSVDYNDDGRLAINGSGISGLDIYIYLDNQHVGATIVNDDGQWNLQLKENIKPGIYTLRIDAAKNKNVISRLEIPFSRAEPLKNFINNAFIVVQPGNSLWRIARKTLGSGMHYTILFEANKDQIGNPNLIYPGQIFQVPNN